MVETQEEGQRKNNTEKNCLYVRWGKVRRRGSGRETGRRTKEEEYGEGLLIYKVGKVHMWAEPGTDRDQRSLTTSD